MGFGTSISLGTPNTSFGVRNPMLGGADASFIEAQKAKERQAIQALKAAKAPYLSQVAGNSKKQLEELSAAMHSQTSTTLPDTMDDALDGVTFKEAKKYITGVKKPNLTTPIKPRILA